MTEGVYYRNTGVKIRVIREIRALAKKNELESVMLYGARAQGTHEVLSDIRLAVSGGNTCRFAQEAEDETSTLLRFDIVDAQTTIQQEILDSIADSGIYIYDRKHEKYSDAVRNLQTILNSQAPYSEADLETMTLVFRECFDQSLEKLKCILELGGYGFAYKEAPKKVLKCAFREGLIEDEDGWITALSSAAALENGSADTAEKTGIIEGLKGGSYTIFYDLLEKLDSERI